MQWHSPIAVLALPGVLSRAQQEPPPLPWSCRDFGPTGGSTHPGDKLGALPGALLSSRSTAGVCLRLGDGTGQPHSTQHLGTTPVAKAALWRGAAGRKSPFFWHFPSPCAYNFAWRWHMIITSPPSLCSERTSYPCRSRRITEIAITEDLKKETISCTDKAAAEQRCHCLVPCLSHLLSARERGQMRSVQRFA